MTIDELAARIAAHYPQEKMDAIRKEFGTGHWEKFWAIDTYARRAAEKAFECQLQNSPRRRVMDIGAGLGYFGVAAAELGHFSASVEIPHRIIQQVYLECATTTWMTPYRLKAGVPIDGSDPRFTHFDLITLFGVNLCKTRTDANHSDPPPKSEWWDASDYEFLFADLWKRLNPRGVIRTEFNWGDETKFLETHVWKQPFTRKGNVIILGPK